MRSVDKHRQAAGQGPVMAALVTARDPRTPATDENGLYLREQFTSRGHFVAGYQIVKDEPDQVAAVFDVMVAIPEVQLVLFNGGTGIATPATAYDGIGHQLVKVLSRFGEGFRMLS